MKKLFLILFLVTLVLTGCQLGNTPTSRVEDYLTKHQMLDKSISTNYLLLADDENIDRDLREEYQKLIQKQYQNLSYEIKDEKVDGNSATVEVEIKVVNYQKVLSKYEMGNNTSEDVHREIIRDLSKEKEKVKYTIYFQLTKDQDGEWIVDPIDSSENKKLLGIYS